MTEIPNETTNEANQQLNLACRNAQEKKGRERKQEGRKATKKDRMYHQKKKRRNLRIKRINKTAV